MIAIINPKHVLLYISCVLDCVWPLDVASVAGRSPLFELSGFVRNNHA